MLSYTRTGFVRGRGWLDAARPRPDLTHDTFNGLLAFVLPGSDAWSLAQGVSTADPGGVDTGVTDVLIATIDESTPFVPASRPRSPPSSTGLPRA